MRPDCPDALRLMAYLDGELSPGERETISGHISRCPECSSFIETQRELESSWRNSWQDPPDFRFSAMRRKLFRGGHFRLPGWAIGMAAGAAAVFLGIRVFQPSDRSLLDSRLRGEEALGTAPSVPVVTDSPASIDSTSFTVPVAEEMQEECPVGQQMDEAVPVEPESAGTGGIASGVGHPVPDEAVSTSGEDSALRQSPGYGSIPEDREGPALEEGTLEENASVTGMLAGASGMQSAGGGGAAAASEAEVCESMTVSTVSASQNQDSCGRSLSVACDDALEADAEVTVTLLCERYDGAPVSPWKELRVFVDSLLQTRPDLPAIFHIDPLGYTVEQDGIPRVWLGVDDPAIVPLTVRVILH